MARLFSFRKKFFTALALASALLVAGQAAWAASTFEVTNEGNVFTITRSETTAVETALYRTVSFSALADKHFTEVSGTLSFAVGEASKTVTVTETADIGALAVPYRYQAFESRTYRFEVLNTGGNCVAFCDRDIPYGSSYQVLPENLFQNVAITAFTDPVTVDDVGFGTAPNTYHAINIGNYFSAAAPQEYVRAIGAQLAMSFDFQACEIDDGYQYLQVLVDDDTNYDGGNQDGKVGDIVYARYMAGFGHYPGVKNTSYAYYTFPYAVGGGDITQGCIVGLWEKYGNPESLLYSQRIKPGYHHGHSGRVLADANLQKLGVRFDASGKHDDKWKVKDFKAHLQAIDDCAPTMLESDVKVSAGPYNAGNTFYVSVPFSEIVYANTVFYVDETPTITTTWGKLTYYTGKGTNVLTFKGEIGYNLDTGTSLTITGLSGRVHDMRGNLYTGSTQFINVTIPSYKVEGQWGSDNGADGTEAHPYVISSKDDFEALAARVNGGDDFGPDASHPDGYFFQQAINISYEYTSGGNNYVAIGTKDNPFRGNYDGKGFVISGIQILKVNGNDADSYQGVFGHVVGGTVKNVIVKNADIWGNNYIAGVVGCCEGGVISGCNVLGLKVTSGGNNRGVIVGNNSATLSDNYYRDCAVGISTNASTSSIGYFNGHSLVDEEGAAEPVYTLNLDNGLSASGATFTLSEVSYYAKNTEVTLSYNGSVDAGFNALYYGLTSLSLSSDYSNYGLVDEFTFRMPGEDLNASVITNNLALALFDDDSARPAGKKNADYIAVGGGPKKVEIHGRRLYQDGEWNTLCLPFDMALADTPLAGATLMELDVDNTRFDAGTGTLFLRFKEATSITAGKPFLIKWGAKEGAAGYVGTAIDSPRFNSVTINAGAPAVVTSADGYVSFTGNYSPLTSDNTMLLLDGSASIGAFRAYIQMNKGITVNDILVYNTSGDVEDPVTLTGHYCDGFYWASYFNGEESPCMLTAGAQAFTMDAAYNLHRLGDDGRIIPTNTAVVILSEREQITLTPTRETASPHGTNILRGSEVPVAVANAYVLGISGGKIGFFSFTGAEVPAKKAYYVKP